MGDLDAQFPVRVLQVLSEAGYTTGVTPGAGITPPGYTGPQLVFGAKSVGPVVLQTASGGGTATATVSQAAEQATGDLILLWVSHDSAGTPSVSSSPGGNGTVLAHASFANGRYVLLSLPYTAGDGPPIVLGDNGSHLWTIWGCLVRKSPAANATVDQNQSSLPNASPVTNYACVLATALTITKPNSLVLFYGNHFGAASSTAVNKWIPPALMSAAYSAADDSDSWPLFPVFIGPEHGDEAFCLASYRVGADKTPLVSLGYVGANGGGGNQPFAAINFY